MEIQYEEIDRKKTGTVHRFRLTTLNNGSAASTWFDMLRWIAALYVMIFHLRPALLLGIDRLHSPSLLVKGLYAITSLGYQFVMLFFILSGFLISSKVLTEIQTGNWSWSKYLIDRVVRLWVVLVPALLVTWGLAQIESVVFHNHAYFASSIAPSVFIGNLFFLQGIFVTNFAQNLPLWSLAYEFWYYILFPCLLLVFYSKKLSHKVLYGFVCAFIALLVGKSVMAYFLIWLIGFLLVVLPRVTSQRRLLSTGLPLAMLALALSLAIGKYTRSNSDMFASFPVNLLVSLAFAGILYVILHSLNEKIGSGWIRIAGKSATFSYSLYLIHYPIVNMVRVWFGDGHWGKWVPNIIHLICFISIGFVIIIVAWGFSKLTESHTNEVRRWVRNVIYGKALVNPEAPSMKGKSPSFNQRGR